MIAVIRVERNRSKTENVSSTPCFSQNYMLHSNARKKKKKNSRGHTTPSREKKGEFQKTRVTYVRDASPGEKNYRTATAPPSSRPHIPRLCRFLAEPSWREGGI